MATEAHEDRTEMLLQAYLRGGGSLSDLEKRFAVKARGHPLFPELVGFKYMSASPFSEPVVCECRGTQHQFVPRVASAFTLPRRCHSGFVTRLGVRGAAIRQVLQRGRGSCRARGLVHSSGQGEAGRHARVCVRVCWAVACGDHRCGATILSCGGIARFVQSCTLTLVGAPQGRRRRTGQSTPDHLVTRLRTCLRDASPSLASTCRPSPLPTGRSCSS